MPHSERHSQQKAKNYTLLAILLAVVALLFTLAMFKVTYRPSPDMAHQTNGVAQ